MITENLLLQITTAHVFQNSLGGLIIHTKKLLNSDWLRKECSSSVTRVQTTNGFWLVENTKDTTKNQSD